MVGFLENIISENNNQVPYYETMNYIDTNIAFKESRSKLEYLLPEFIKYLGGDRSKSILYGNIKKFYPEEAIYLYRNVRDHNIDDVENIDYIVDSSCILSKDLRIIVIKDEYGLDNISGYDIITFTKGENVINTVIMEDAKLNNKFIFSICIKLFDNVIVSELYKLGVPIYQEKYIPIKYTGTNAVYISKFIIDYLIELLYPFDNRVELDDNEINGIIDEIFNLNFKILSKETIMEIYDYMHGSIKGRKNEYDYIALIIKLADALDEAGPFDPEKYSMFKNN